MNHPLWKPEGGAVPKERHKDGSPKKGPDETMNTKKRHEFTRPLENAGELSNKGLQLCTNPVIVQSDQDVDSSLRSSDDKDSNRDERNRDSSDQATFFQSSTVQFWEAPERPVSPVFSVLSMTTDRSIETPLNFKHRDLPEEKGMRPEEVVCDVCGVKAVKSCRTCTQNYCQTHVKKHYTLPKLQRHKLVDVIGDLEERFCQEHHRPVEVFCRTDQMLICSLCSGTKHREHDTIHVESMNFDGDKISTSDNELSSPEKFQVVLLSSDSVSLSWSSPQGVEGPETFRVTWECNCEEMSSRVKGHHLEISGLKPGEKYLFTVATEGDDGRLSNCISTTLTTVVPPRDLEVYDLDNTSFTLHWTKGEGMEKLPQRFLITYCSPGTDLEPRAVNTEDCYRTFSNLQPGTEYSVSVVTVLNTKEESEPVYVTIQTLLPAPDQLTVDQVDTTSATVIWNQPPGLDQTHHHYQISYQCPGTEPHISTTSSTSITLSDLKPATEYSVTVCTVMDNGKESKLVSTTLNTNELTVDSVDTTSATVIWNQPPGLDQTHHHYQISYQCPGTEPHITTTSSPSITLSDLKPATEYSVSVSTVMDDGKKSQLVTTDLTTRNKQTEEMRIVLLGKTGAGKSAAGNTILGRDAFKSKFSSKSLTSEFEKVRGEVDNQRVAVIDSPGLFDTNYSNEQIIRKIVKCMVLSSPGPHVFLVVIHLDRFTEEEQKTVETIQKIFGEVASKYTMVLFTHGDRLEGEPINDFIHESEDLKNFVVKCNNQYHVFNNKDKDPSQVSELLKKINSMVEKNGGSFYTTEMFQDVEREIEEEKVMILKDNEEKNHKEIEELKKQWEGERLKEEEERLLKEQERQARERAEKEQNDSRVDVTLDRIIQNIGREIGRLDWKKMIKL